MDELASIPRDDRQKTAIRNAKNHRMGEVILVLPSSMLTWSAEREVSRCMCGPKIAFEMQFVLTAEWAAMRKCVWRHPGLLPDHPGRFMKSRSFYKIT